MHDWENYLVSLKGKPVSINVDLGLASIAPVKEDSFVIILRVKMNQLDAMGMPTAAEAEAADTTLSPSPRKAALWLRMGRAMMQQKRIS